MLVFRWGYRDPWVFLWNSINPKTKHSSACTHTHAHTLSLSLSVFGHWVMQCQCDLIIISAACFWKDITQDVCVCVFFSVCLCVSRHTAEFLDVNSLATEYWENIKWSAALEPEVQHVPSAWNWTNLLNYFTYTFYLCLFFYKNKSLRENYCVLTDSFCYWKLYLLHFHILIAVMNNVIMLSLISYFI